MLWAYLNHVLFFDVPGHGFFSVSFRVVLCLGESHGFPLCCGSLITALFLYLSPQGGE